MSDLQTLRQELTETLGAAPVRLLDALIIAVSSLPNAETTKPIIHVPRQPVLYALEKLESSLPDQAVIRDRLRTLNTAIAKATKKKSGTPGTTIKIRSRKDRFEIDRSASYSEEAVRVKLRATLERSTREDASQTDPSETVTPTAILPEFQVFLSHAWETNEIEAVVDWFHSALENKCRALPEPFRNRFRIKRIWLDRKHMPGAASTFEDHFNPACAASQAALFLLSDAWHQSKACQTEARHFHDNRRLHIQLSGRLDDAPEDYRKRPGYPMQWRREIGNLLKIHELSESDKDDFICEIRLQICKILDEIDPSLLKSITYERGSKVRTPDERAEFKRALIEQGRNFDQHVADGSIETPRVRNQEEAEGAVEVLPVLMDWAQNDKAEHRVLALLGSFGAGKTTTAQLFARALLDGNQANPEKTPPPVYLDARRLTELYTPESDRKPTLSRLILEALNPGAGLQIEETQLLSLLRSEPFVVIFDGLDEVGTRIGPERAVQLYRQLLEIIPHEIWQGDRRARKAQWSKCPTRIMVTCRTHFFRDAVAEQGAFNAHDRHDTGIRGARAQLVRTLYMAPFTPDQIRSLFRIYLGQPEGDILYRAIETGHDLRSLAEKPIMSRYIAELAPEIKADQEAGRKINAASIYQHLFRKALERDQDKRPLLTATDRQQLLEALALHLWHCRSATLPCAQLEEWFDGWMESRPGMRLLLAGSFTARTLLQTELRNASLLIREQGDQFQFVHSSFQEFFLARALYRFLLVADWNAMAAPPPVSWETLDFLMDLIEIDQSWTQLGVTLDHVLINGSAAPIRELAVSARSAMARRGHFHPLPTGANLSDLNLQEAKLATAHNKTVRLHSISFKNSLLNGQSFADVEFFQCDFSGSILSDSSFEACHFVDCTGTPKAAYGARSLDCSDDKGQILSSFSFKFTSDIKNNPPTSSTFLIPSNEGITSVTFAPDGMRVLTGSDDGTARLWQIGTGSSLQTFNGHDRGVTSVAFSPDGQRVLTGSDDGTARLWQTDTGSPLQTFKGHDTAVTSVAFSPDGERVLTGSDDRTARLWRAGAGSALQTFIGHEGAITSVAFSPDGQRALTGSDDGTARLWETDTGSPLQIFTEHGRWVSSVAFSLNGEWVLTGSGDGTARLWETDTGLLLRTLNGHDTALNSVAFSPDGQRVLTGSDEGIARLWQIDTDSQLQTFRGHSDWVSSAAFSPDGQRVLTGSGDGTARLWETNTGLPLQTFKGHSGWVTSVAFSPDGAQLLTGSGDGTARLWQADTGSPLQTFIRHGDWISSAAFSPDGQTVATGSSDGTARLWQADTGSPLQTFNGHGYWVNSLAFSPDGERVLTSSGDSVACLWEAKTGSILQTFTENTDWVASVAFSPNGEQIVIGSSDGTAQLWQTSTGLALQTFKLHDRAINAVAFSPNGQRVLTGSGDGTACLWDSNTGSPLQIFKESGYWISSVAFSPDGQRVLTGSGDGTARLWHADNGSPLQTFRGHNAAVKCVAFSPNGERVLTGSDDGTARMWHAHTGKSLFSLMPLAPGWAVLNSDMSVRRIGPDGWKYIMAVDIDENGKQRAICPDWPLPECGPCTQRNSLERFKT